MYQLLLTAKYLTSKIMPLLAACAVALCAAMVLIVWSVMGGFLDMLISSGRTIQSDLALYWPNAGIPYYDELVHELEKDPAVAAAAPTIETFGLIILPNDLKRAVQVKGIEGESFSRVSSYKDILWWRPISTPTRHDKKREDLRLRDPILRVPAQTLLEQGLTLERINPKTHEQEPAAVLGIAVSGLNNRTDAGIWEPLAVTRAQSNGTIDFADTFMPRDGSVTINVVPLDAKGNSVELSTMRLPVANEFASGVADADTSVVFVRLDALQRALKLNEAPKINTTDTPYKVVLDPKTGKETFVLDATPAGTIPARATHILIRGQGDVKTDAQARALKDACLAVYASFAERHRGEVPGLSQIQAMTWREQNQTMIDAVQKEQVLLLVLFGIISFVAVMLILAIFWSMVAERTKDIGTIRAIGASRSGIAGIWVCYGCAIGLVGGGAGLAIAYAIVTNINPIHEWLGRQLGIVIWNPAVYVFDTIPNTVRSVDALWVFALAVLASAGGALIPAVRAALMDPVKALRFE
ncbi:MAG: ABC transporter permease [Phycisphaerales bacterium]|nr:MAG: ABC transporter permease [Phycisphaerales bacterium]